MITNTSASFISKAGVPSGSQPCQDFGLQLGDLESLVTSPPICCLKSVFPKMCSCQDNRKLVNGSKEILCG